MGWPNEHNALMQKIVNYSFYAPVNILAKSDKKDFALIYTINFNKNQWLTTLIIIQYLSGIRLAIISFVEQIDSITIWKTSSS